MEKDLLKAKKILRKYRDGTCTTEEKAWVEEWYLRFDACETDLNDDELKEDLEELKARLGSITRRKSRRYIPFKAAAAILIFLSTGIGIYWYGKINSAQTQLTSKYSDDVLPGGNRAILRLSDGSTIDLDSSNTGLLIEEQGVKITKGKDGVIAYKVRSDGLEIAQVDSNTIITPNGGQYKVILPDGSKVWLNAASSLTYPTRFDTAERKVVLTGEGYFEVAHNQEQSFVVQSKGQQVTVLGTRFNINAYGNAASVNTTLIGGSVRVTHTETGETKLLQPGEQSRITRERFEVNPVDVEESIAWKNGQFIFNNTDLKTIMQQLERWYDVEVDYTQLPERRFYGKVSRGVPLSKVLDMMEQTSSLNFKIKGREISMDP